MSRSNSPIICIGYIFNNTESSCKIKLEFLPENIADYTSGWIVDLIVLAVSRLFTLHDWVTTIYHLGTVVCQGEGVSVIRRSSSFFFHVLFALDEDFALAGIIVLHAGQVGYDSSEVFYTYFSIDECLAKHPENFSFQISKGFLVARSGSIIDRDDIVSEFHESVGDASSETRVVHDEVIKFLIIAELIE